MRSTLNSQEENLICNALHLAGGVFHENAIEKGFWPLKPEGGIDIKARNQGELIALMHSELSEALEAIRYDNAQKLFDSKREINTMIDPNGVIHRMDKHCPEYTSEEVEFADCIIRILEYATAYKLRIGEAMMAKHRFNQTRPHKHGKAF